jgi:hypothetical protein
VSADSGIRTVVEAIAYRWRQITPGAAHYDLSEEGAVLLGEPTTHAPTQLPQVWLAPGAATSERGPELGRWTRTLEVRARGYVGDPEGSATPGERYLLAADLLDDLSRVLEIDPGLGLSRVLHGIDLEVRAEALDGDDLGLGHYGVVDAIVSIRWFTDGGF